VYRLDFKGLDGIYVCIDIIRHRFEVFQQLLCLVDYSLVLQYGAVMCEVNGGRLRVVLSGEALGLRVSFAEGLERGNGF
jgi:hypothetical protein